jgi:hypothetical protein
MDEHVLEAGFHHLPVIARIGAERRQVGVEA